MFVRLLALLFVVASPLASFSQTAGIQDADSVPDTCPVTKPSDKPLVPPYPYPATPYPGGSWFGTDRLWIAGPPVAWKGLPHDTPNDPTFTQKMQWWRQGSHRTNTEAGGHWQTAGRSSASSHRRSEQHRRAKAIHDGRHEFSYAWLLGGYGSLRG